MAGLTKTDLFNQWRVADAKARDLAAAARQDYRQYPVALQAQRDAAALRAAYETATTPAERVAHAATAVNQATAAKQAAQALLAIGRGSASAVDAADRDLTSAQAILTDAVRASVAAPPPPAPPPPPLPTPPGTKPPAPQSDAAQKPTGPQTSLREFGFAALVLVPAVAVLIFLRPRG